MSYETPALIFGPGLPPGGLKGSLSISTLGVEITAGEHSQRAPISDVALREAGFGQFGLELSWAKADETWAAHVLDAHAAQELLTQPALADTPQARALRTKTRRNTAGRSLGWTLLATFILLPLLLLAVALLNAN